MEVNEVFGPPFILESNAYSTSHFSIDTLLTGDRELFALRPGDDFRPITITIADLKTLALAINVLNDRVLGLLKDVERAEERIDALERER